MAKVVSVSTAQSGAPPTHYTVKIQSFSLLVSEKYESGTFEAGGYKWKLVIHPKGNKSKNVSEHLSLYIAVADTIALRPGWEVHVEFRLFLLDHNKDTYFIIPDSSGKEWRFHGMGMKYCGFDEFMSLATFIDPKNGYLVEDTCVFGAEVFVRKESCSWKGECLSMVKSPSTSKNVFWFYNFSKMDAKCNDSDTFVSGDQRWKIQMYPKGKDMGSGTHLSLYIALADSNLAASTILADITLRILNQIGGSHRFGKASVCFSPSSSVHGWSRFISLDQLSLSNNGYLLKDICQVEAEMTVLGISNVF